MTFSRFFSCLFIVMLAGTVSCSAGSDTTGINPGGSVALGDTAIVWTDTNRNIIKDGDSTDWQPRWDYQGPNEIGVMPFWPNPTSGTGKIAFKMPGTMFIRLMLDTDTVVSQNQSAGQWVYLLDLTKYSVGIHHVQLFAGPSEHTVKLVSKGEIRKR